MSEDCAKDGKGNRELDIRPPLNKTFLLCTLALTMLVAANANAAEKTYLDWVSESTSAIEAGRMPDAVKSLRQALVVNANDPLAHCELGFALLVGGRPASEARAQFSEALRLDPDCATANYGLGLVALAKPDLSEAARLFCQAQQQRPDLDMAGAIGYVRYIAGGNYDPPAENPYDESLQALRALALMRTGAYGDAEAVWRDLQKKAFRAGCGERLGCSMTFDRLRPLALTGWGISKPYSAPAATQSNLTKVSGNVSLRADLTNAREVHIVSFFVDGSFVGMSNTPPFNYVWDTTKTPNGVHTVKIEGSDSTGAAVTTKSMNVAVANKGAARPSARATGERADQLWQRLWACMCVKPSSAVVNYNIALCAAHRGDRDEEKAALERVLAADPGCSEAAKRLSAIYGPSAGASALYEGRPTRKVIALTFDDGPKADTGRILDILRTKGVKATFFLVGKQADAFPETVKRIASEGHQIGCHTYDHRDLEYLTESEITQEIFKTTATVRMLTGRDVRYLRPPGGHEGKKLPNVARRFGLTTVFWSSNCSPYEGKSRKKLTDYVVSSAKPGGIILLHNLELVTLQALPDIIDSLRRRGYEFVTVSELPR